MKLGWVLAAMAAATCFATAEDWPQFRGIRGDAISTEKGINKKWNKKPPKQLWKLPVGDEGYAGPAVANGKVFFVDHSGNDDVVRAVDLKDGKEVWRYAYPETDQPKYGYARATPTVRDGKVYTFSRLGTLNCLDEKTGKKIWSINTVKDLGGSLPYQWDASASPTIDGNKVLVVTGVADKPLAALDKDTGAVLWQGGAPDAPSHCTPIAVQLDSKKQYLQLFGGKLQGIDPATGASLWSVPWLSVNIPEPIVTGPNTVFLTTFWEKVGCGLIQVKDNHATKVWESRKLMCYFNTPVLINGYLYGTGKEPVSLVCLQAATGKEMWRKPGFADGGIVAIDGTLIIVDGSNGDLTMVQVSSAGYKELGKVKGLGGQSWSPPIVSGGKLIVRNTKAIACYDLM